VSVAPVISAGNLVGVAAPMAMPLTPSHTGTTENTPPMPTHVHSSEPPPLPLRASRGPAHASQPAPKTVISSPPSMSNRPPPPTIQPFVEAPLPPPTVPVRVSATYRESLGSIDESDELPGAPRRLGGWIVAFVLLAGAGVIGFAFAKPYLAAQSAQSAASATALDPRAQQLLADGERAMASGDLDSANEDFAKASVLAENEPHVLVDEARLANVRADVPWLRAKILPSDATDDLKAIKSQLDDLAARAKKAADQAMATAPGQQAATLAKIDALRLSGDSASARALVSKVAQNGSQPETAYVLAALDLGEPQPLWPMVIERLRIAAAGEGDAGRARAALVYALAQSGDTAGAKTELEKLAGLARPSPLVGALRAFIAKTPDAANAKDAGAKSVNAAQALAGMAAATATVDVNALPHAAPPTTTHGGGGGGNPNDPRILLQQAESAKDARDWDRARALYSSALAQNGSDSEALAGLGDCDHGAHDLPGAATYYHRALAVNPVYLPALVGLADVEWESGDRDEAQKTYHDIADRFPEGTYPGRVKQRANDSSGGIAAPRAVSTDTAPAATASSDPTGSP
jgi:Flp pilus assembly protein TadD